MQNRKFKNYLDLIATLFISIYSISIILSPPELYKILNNLTLRRTKNLIEVRQLLEAGDLKPKAGFASVVSPEKIRVEEIFVRVTKEQGLQGINLPVSYREFYANLLRWKISNAEALIENDIRKHVSYSCAQEGSNSPTNDYERYLRGRYDELVAFYKKNLASFSEEDFLSYDSFRIKFFLTANELSPGASANKFLREILVNYESLSSDTVWHEGIHVFNAGFVHEANVTLDEGITNLIIKEISGKDPSGPRYRPYVAVAEELANVVGRDALFRAYITGSHEPFRGTLGSEVVDLFELTEILTFIYGEEVAKQVFATEDNAISHILKIRESKEEIARLKKDILEYLHVQ